jgi:hypothetical protein
MAYLGTYDGVNYAVAPVTSIPVNGGDYVCSSIVGTVYLSDSGISVNIGDMLVWTVPLKASDPVAYWRKIPILSMQLPALAPYLPDYFQPIQDYNALLAAEQTNFSQLNSDLSQLAANNYIQTCDIPTLIQHELLFGINASTNSSVESIQFRRDRVLGRYAQVLPYTLQYLQQLIENMVGVGNAVVLINDANGYNYRLDAVLGDDGALIDGTHGWFLGQWPSPSFAVNLPFITSGFQIFVGFVPSPTNTSALENEVLSIVNTIKPCHMEADMCTILFEPTSIDTSLLTNALLVMHNGVNIDIPNVIHVGSRDSLGRIPIVFTINYSDIGSSALLYGNPTGDPSGRIDQIGLQNSSGSVNFVQMLYSSYITIPSGGSVNIMFLIT